MLLTKHTNSEYKAKATVPRRDFRVLWDAGEEDVQMSVVSHRPDADKDGYFMLLIQPQFPAVEKNKKKIGCAAKQICDHMCVST